MVSKERVVTYGHAMEMDGKAVRPWILGRSDVLTALEGRAPSRDVLRFDVLDPDTLPFFRLVNAGNAVAFGTLSMPPWVQLDACTLPSAMVGFAMQRAQLPQGLWDRLLEQVGTIFGIAAQEGLQSYEGWVPISEYCALPAWEPGLAVGVSLYSLVPKHHWGLRTKAFALACYGIEQQIGATQYGNAAVRIHTALGPLRIETPRVAAHSRSEETFVYRLDVPDAATLARIMDSGEAVAPLEAEHVVEGTGGELAQRVAELVSTGAAPDRQLAITSAEPLSGEVTRLRLCGLPAVRPHAGD